MGYLVFFNTYQNMSFGKPTRGLNDPKSKLKHSILTWITFAAISEQGTAHMDYKAELCYYNLVSNIVLIMEDFINFGKVTLNFFHQGTKNFFSRIVKNGQIFVLAALM